MNTNCLASSARPAKPAFALAAERGTEPRSFALGEGFGICLGTEALDAYRAVLDDPHIMQFHQPWRVYQSSISRRTRSFSIP